MNKMEALDLKLGLLQIVDLGHFENTKREKKVLQEYGGGTTNLRSDQAPNDQFKGPYVFFIPDGKVPTSERKVSNEFWGPRNPPFIRAWLLRVPIWTLV